MKWGIIVIILLWSASGYGGFFSFLEKIKGTCSKSFWSSKSQEVSIKPGEQNAESREVEVEEAGTTSSLFVLVVRHASYHGTLDTGTWITREQAEAHGLSDTRLHLSKEGKEKFKEMCKAKESCTFDLLIHSRAIRTWETANIFSEHFTVKERRISDNLAEREVEPENLLQEIREANVNTVVLVGHQPSLARFISKALGENDSIIARMLLEGYGSMIPLKFSSWDFGSAEIHSFNF